MSRDPDFPGFMGFIFNNMGKIAVIGIVGQIVIYGALVWVAWHFISKLW